MKVSVKSVEIDKALKVLKYVANKKTAPYIKLTVKDGNFQISVGNSEEVLTYKFEHVNVIEDGECLVGFDFFNSIPKCKKDDLVEFETGKDYLKVKVNSGDYVLERNTSIDDMRMWSVTQVDIETKPVFPEFLNNYRKLLPFLVTKDSYRSDVLSLYSVRLDVKEEQHYMVSTDGTRLTCLEVENLPLTVNCNMPYSKFLEKTKLEEGLEIGVTKIEKEVWFGLKTSLWEYKVKIQTNYPDWRQAMPKGDDNKSIIFGSQDVLKLPELIKGLPVVQKNNPVKIIKQQGKVCILQLNSDENVNVKIELQDSSLEGFECIRVNSKFLREAIEAGFTEFKYNEEYGLIYSFKEKEKHVLMLMRSV